MLPVRHREAVKITGDIRWQGFKVPLVSWAALPQACYCIGLIKVSVTRNRIGQKEGKKISPKLGTEYKKKKNV